MIEKREPSKEVPPIRRELCEQSAGRVPVLSVRSGTPSPSVSRVPAMAPGACAGPAFFPPPMADSLFVVLWRSRWILLVCVVGALMVGAVYLQTVAPTYVSTAKLWLVYTGIRINPYEPGARPQTDKYLLTQAERIKSSPVLGVVLEALVPRRLRTFEKADVPAACLQRNLSVEVGKKEEIISVSFRSAHPVEAAEIANQVVSTYMASRSEDEQKDSANALRILQEEMRRAKEELDGKQKELTDFQTSHMPLALGSDQGGGVMQRYLELQDMHTQAQRETIDANAFRTQVQLLASDAMALRQYLQTKGNLNPYAGADPEKMPLEARAIDLELQKESFLETITPSHPKVNELTTGVERIRTRLQVLNDRFVEAARAAAERRYAEARDYEEQLARLYGQQQEQVVKVNAEIAQYQRLRSEVAQVTRYVEMLDEQVRAIRKIEGEDVGQLRMAILEPALPAEAPATPQKSRVMAMVLVVGLLLGGGIAVGRDWLDQTLRSTDEVSALLGLPILGVVPAMSRRQKVQDRGLAVLLQPDSHEAEAFRTVRTALFFGAPTYSARTMLITSPATGDGKSTLISNLAIAMARAGQKTLILDADFRKPTQHLVFELNHAEQCLSSVFAGRTKLSAAIQPTRVKGLHLLTCGQGVFNPAEVLNSQQFVVLLKRLAEWYDRVLIDAPPVTVVTDAQIIGALCDTTVLVLRAERSTRKAARSAVTALQSVGAHVLGVVINEARKNGDRYGGYYGSYYGRHKSESGNGSRGERKSHVAGSRHPELPAGVAPERA